MIEYTADHNARDTIKKLNDARVHLHNLMNYKKLIFSDDMVSLRAEVNAFISAMRSITLVLQKESSKSGIKYYKSIVDEVTSNNNYHAKLFKFFNKKRVDSIHKHSVEIERCVFPVTVTECDGIPVNRPSTVILIKFKDIDDSIGSRNVFSLCENYFLFTRNLIYKWIEYENKNKGIDHG